MPVHSTNTTRRRLRKPFAFSVSTHVSETIPAGVRIPTAATTIPAGSSVDAGMSDQRHQELDAAQLIYTKADWLDLLAKIATNSALSK
uniref:Uncharacterized protein n=1 Tax=Tanacetum cinerariifolium TaxID=118510 RepID=A0A699TQU0_TANCI|nr:hypothetical protein [Tanacetum cinerariifolium]